MHNSGCPTGYFGDDCSKQCVPPTYGEDCQSLYSCTDGFNCHFAFGCLLHQENETALQQTTKRIISNTCISNIYKSFL